MIAVISTFDPVRLPMAEAFCRHYRALGADEIRITLQLEPSLSDGQRAAHVGKAEQVLAMAGASLDHVLVEPFYALTLRRNHNWRQNLLPKRYEWIVWADSDELQEHPQGLAETARQLEREGHDAKPGRLVDRLARNGILPSSEACGRSPWETFPLGTDLSARVLAAKTEKIVLARRNVRIGIGNHHVRRGQQVCIAPEVTAVHHFKWDARATERLRRRLEPDWKARCPWWTESAAALAWIERGGGAVPLHGLTVVDFGDDRPGDNAGPLSGNGAYNGGPYW